jgi:transposase
MLAGILVFAGVVLWLLFRLHQSTQLNVEKYRRKWLEIEQLLKKDDQRSCQFAIIEADKLLDIAMKESGIRGDTMGERLKTARGRWSDRNAIWTAHKLRNQIVHEADVAVGYDTVRRALASFKRALKDMGAI